MITKDLNSSSSNLFGAHCVSTQLTNPRLKLNFLGTNAQGKTQPRFTIELTNAAVVKYLRKPQPHGNFRLQRFGSREWEEIQFVFQKITFTWVQGGTTMSDDWELSA